MGYHINSPLKMAFWRQKKGANDYDQVAIAQLFYIYPWAAKRVGRYSMLG